MSRSMSFTDSYARNSASVIPSVPRPFNALHARRMDSRSWTWDRVSDRRPFWPGRAPGSIFDLSMYSKAACRCFRTMYGQRSAISGPMARPLSAQIHDGRAFTFFWSTGPVIEPPARDLHRCTRTSSVLDMEMVADHDVVPRLVVYFVIMYVPSPSSNPARYAESVGSMGQSYRASVTKPSYWRTAVDNLTRLETEMTLPSLFDDEMAS